MWVRGLKHNKFSPVDSEKYVAPYVGAWIETPDGAIYGRDGGSHPMWVRGLKQNNQALRIFLYLSHPMWVRGLKQRWHQDAQLLRCRTLCGCVD